MVLSFKKSVRVGASCRNGDGSPVTGNTKTCLHVTIQFKLLYHQIPATTLARFISFPHAEHSEELEHQTLFILFFFNVNIRFLYKTNQKVFTFQELSPEFWISSATADNFAHA